MSHVVDHTVLTEYANTPLWGDVLVEHYTKIRQIIVVPTTSLMHAATDKQGVERLTLLASPLYATVVKFVELDVETALRIGSSVQMADEWDDAPGLEIERWHLIAPVVWIARQLAIRVLTAKPGLYEGYGVEVDRMP